MLKLLKGANQRAWVEQDVGFCPTGPMLAKYQPLIVLKFPNHKNVLSKLFITFASFCVAWLPDKTLQPFIFSPVYWEILDLTDAHPETKELFSTADWNEMLKSFEDDVKMAQEESSDAVYLLFDRIDEVDG